jgi:hypothetical protein
LCWRIIEVGEMKAPIWKAVFAVLNPSPAFEAVAMFAEELVISSNGLDRNESVLTNWPDRVRAISSDTRRAEIEPRLARTSAH